MDFASLMKAQIAKGKASAAPAQTEGAPKYLKRSEVEAQREAAYRKEQEELENARAEKQAKKRKLQEEEREKELEREEKKRKLIEESRRRREEDKEKEDAERRKRLGLPELKKKDTSETPLEEGEEDIEEEALIEKLRGLDEPTKLFGEDHVARLRRYKRLIGTSLAPKLSDGPIPTILELVEEKDMKVPLKPPTDAAGKKFVYRQLASYFDMLLREWAIAMARRPDDVKDSYSGRLALKAMTSALDSLRPFFKKLESGDIDHAVLEGVLEIVHAAQERRYVDANDSYLRLSIGKAAWPIGVTMVGIHERSAREKLHENENEKAKAHIMSDEVTRKYLQGIKRCLSFAQVRWPPSDHLQLMG